MNILVVEDDRQVLSFIVQLIETWGYQVDQAETGHEAIDKAGQTQFDLTILDVFLPDMTIFELITRLKEELPEKPLITMTGHNTFELEQKIRSLGITYYMAKPFHPEELKSILDHISKKMRKEVKAA